MLFSKKTLPAELISLMLPYEGVGDRLVRIYLPEREKGETFPVIYMPAGQTVFDEESNPTGCWHTREAVVAEYAVSGRKAVIVGVHTALEPMRRTAELTPASMGQFVPPPLPEDEIEEMMKNPPQGLLSLPDGITREMLTPELVCRLFEDTTKDFAPVGETFDDFVIKVVKPEVEKRFPVKLGRANTAIIGSSSAGLEAFFIGMSHPELFCAIGALSPVFMFYSEEDNRKWIEPRLGEDMPFLYLFCGEGEPKEKEIYDGAKATFEFIKSRSPKGKVKEVIDPDAIHNENAWEPVFKDFLHLFLTGQF